MHQQTATVTAVPETQVARTFLEKLNEVMATGNFVDVDQQATDDEPVIGTMTDYERALHTLKVSYHDDQKALYAKNFNALQEFTGNPEHRSEINRQLKSMKEHHDATNKLLWASILDRLFRQSEQAEDSTGIGIRQGFQIVLNFKDHARDSLEALLMAMSAFQRMS